MRKAKEIVEENNEKVEVVEKRQRKKIKVTESMTEYLIQMAKYRFMTSEQITRLNHSMGTITTVRSRLRDLVAGEYINETVIPTKKRLSQNIYAIGTKGARYLENHVGVEVKKFYEPQEFEDLEYAFMWHVLQLNDFIISAKRVEEVNTGWYLDSFMHDLEMEDKKIRFEAMKQYTVWNGKEDVVKEKKESTWVHPDGVLFFRKKMETGKIRQAVYFVELDRGTEATGVIREKIRKYYYAITSGVLAKHFDIPHIHGILFTTTSKSGDRVKELQKSAMTVLGGLHAKKDIIDLFLFNEQEARITGIDTKQTFFAPVWKLSLKESPAIALLT